MLPERVIRSAGPTDHRAAKQVRDDGREDHPERLSLDVRDGIESDLPSTESGWIAAQFGNQGMGGFVAGRREQKDQIPDQAQGQKFAGYLLH